MAPFLNSLLTNNTLESTSDLQEMLKSLQEKNKAQLEALNGKLTDAQDNLGETEIADALKARAHYLAKIGEKVHSIIIAYH